MGTEMMRELYCDAVIFDMDGTLLDTMGIWDSAPLALLAEHGVACTEQVASTFHGLGFEAAAEHLSRTYLPQYAPETLMEQIVARVTEAYCTRVQPKPGAGELLRELSQRGIPLACDVQPKSARGSGIPTAGLAGFLPSADHGAGIRLQQAVAGDILLCRRAARCRAGELSGF